MSLCVLGQHQEYWEYITFRRLCVVFLYFMTNLLELFIFIQEVKVDRHSKPLPFSVSLGGVHFTFPLTEFWLSPGDIVPWNSVKWKLSYFFYLFVLLSLEMSWVSFFVPHCHSQTICPLPKYFLLSGNTCFQSVWPTPHSIIYCLSSLGSILHINFLILLCVSF